MIWMGDIYELWERKRKAQRQQQEQSRKKIKKKIQNAADANNRVAKRRKDWLDALDATFTVHDATIAWEVSQQCAWKRIEDLKKREMVCKTSFYCFQKIRTLTDHPPPSTTPTDPPKEQETSQ